MTTPPDDSASLDDGLLFVYGTLLAGVGHPMHRILAGGAELVGRASMPGRLFLVASYPGLVESDDPGRRVRGELYRLAGGPESRRAALARLDSYEGCSPRDPRPHAYARVRRPCFLDDGTALEAWVYRYVRDTTGLREIRSGDFLDPGAIS